MFGATGVRSRWAAAGAMLALTMGAGGVLTSSAAGSPAASSFVPITPCRLFDTRPTPDTVGTRAIPLGPRDTLVAQVTGSNGDCVIPANATAASMNVTIVAPSSSSFLTVYPSDKPRPLASNLNWIANQSPTPNAVTVALSADGKASFYNLSGTVNLAVDIVGFYEPSASGPTGPVSPDGVLTVAKANGDYTRVSDALAAIGTTLPASGATRPYLIKVAPGTYTETATLAMKDHVDLEGSGQGTTTITCACASATNPYSDAGARVTLRAAGPNLHTEIRNITIVNTGGNLYSFAIFTGGTSAGELSLRNVSVTATGGTNRNQGVVNISSSPSMADMTILASGGITSINHGVVNDGGGSPTLTNVSATGSGGDAYGAAILSGTVLIRDSYFQGTANSILRIAGNVRVLNTVFNGVTAGLTGSCVNAMTTGLTPYTCA